jgi:hypothetical protein
LRGGFYGVFTINIMVKSNKLFYHITLPLRR